MTGLHPVSPATRAALVDAGLDPDAVVDVITRTLAEDLAGGRDVTTDATVPAGQRSRATLGARAPGCVAGVVVAAAVFECVCGADSVRFDTRVGDGARVVPATVLADIEAPTRSLLTAERTALNLLCHLSGVATATARWVDAVAGTGAAVRDTRKTTPGLRMLEKYAVRCGGGLNHRMGLFDAALVKDNHIAAAGGVAEAFRRVRAAAADLPIEIEVDDLDQLREALEAGADLVLLDNMDPHTMERAVAIAADHRAATGRTVMLEASGGLTIDNARAVAATGVDFISVGGLTHSSPILDIGLDFVAVL